MKKIIKAIISSKILTLLIISGIFIFPTTTLAVVQSLNGQSGQTQLFANDTNVTINSTSNTHSLGWSGILSVSRGGTGESSFTNGSILFSNGTSIAQDNSNLFWDNITHSLTIGGNLNIGNNIVAGNLSGTNTGDQNLSDLVPYTGATGPVNLGAFDLTVQSMTIGHGGGGFTTGNDNTAVGFATLTGEIPLSSESNTAVGSRVLSNAISGSFNTGIGRQALNKLTTGNYNTVVGHDSTSALTTGNANIGIGNLSLVALISGNNNIAIGERAMGRITTGGGNIGIGDSTAQVQADGNTFLTNPVNSIYIGNGILGFDNNDNNTIVIGNSAIGAGANKAVIGNSSVTDVYFGSSAGNANLHAANICEVSSGSSAPSSIPVALGQVYIDTSAAKVYISTGTSSSSDWVLIN
ncbi:MAG: hypothetical protein UT00_C0004G0016 [Parcubacteria group bacterium GW2011_GWA1_38_7]|nr:MAG: hypothetical protein UT00_C0004G0016 [Parcubacteria group bacterium GW2011_GWA1_38_7]